MTAFRILSAGLALAALLGLAVAVPIQAQTPFPVATVTPPRPGVATTPGVVVTQPVVPTTPGVVVTPTVSAVVQAMTPPLTATLIAEAEVPGPGDSNGLGSAAVTSDPATRTVCYAIHVVGIATPTAAHIHQGVVGVAGSIVVPFDPPTGGDSSGCVQNVDADLATRIRDNPADFYVNVHNADYPDGALRGQLGR
jgi:CHRD domain